MEKTIQQAVAEKLTDFNPLLFNAVADKLAGFEIQKRIELLSKAIQKQEQLDKDLKKIDKNDVVTFAAGNKQEAMSKARFDEINKAKEKVQKLTKAIETCLTENNQDSYTKLTETLNKVSNVGGTQKDDSAEGTD